MPLVKIKPNMSHRGSDGEPLEAGDVFDASPAEMESFGDKFVLMVVEVEPVKDDRAPVSWTEVVATPSARRLAQEHGISPALSNIVGTGRDGKITKADVVAFLNNEAKDDIEASLKVVGQLMQPDHLASLVSNDIEALPNGDAQ